MSDNPGLQRTNDHPHGTHYWRTRTIELQLGAHKGYALPPTLSMGYNRVSVADLAVSLTSAWEAIQRTLISIGKEANAVGLRMNTPKANKAVFIIRDGVALKNVDSFKLIWIPYRLGMRCLHLSPSLPAMSQRNGPSHKVVYHAAEIHPIIWLWQMTIY